jgi:hypothetical protein
MREFWSMFVKIAIGLEDGNIRNEKRVPVGSPNV